MSRDSEINTLLERFVIPERLERLESVLEARTNQLTIVLENIRNAHNISAVLRSADAFGVTTVHAICSEDRSELDYSSAISLGTERWMQLVQHADSKSAIAQLRTDGFAIVVLQPEEDLRFSATPGILKCAVTELPFERPLALVFGNEHRGVSPWIVESADFHASIPMYGFVESLNISVACAITLFCSTIAKTSPAKRCAPLGDEERHALRARWLEKSVKGSELILRDIEKRKNEDGEEEP